MNQKEIWRFLLLKSKAKSKPFDRELLWVQKSDFLKVIKNFRTEFNFFHSGKSLRSGEFLWHIHAVEQKKYFLIHRDFGNPARFLPLGLLHLFHDVIPFFIFLKVKGLKMQNLFRCPTEI